MKAWQAEPVRDGAFEGAAWAVVGDPVQVVLMVVRNDSGGGYLQILCLPFLLWAAGAPANLGDDILMQLTEAELSSPQPARRVSGSFAIDLTLDGGTWAYAVLTPTGLQQER